jgi:hypothetical protein
MRMCVDDGKQGMREGCGAFRNGTPEMDGDSISRRRAGW